MLLSSQVTVVPVDRKMLTMSKTSLMRGMLDKITGPVLSSAAQMIARALFLEPFTLKDPES